MPLRKTIKEEAASIIQLQIGNGEILSFMNCIWTVEGWALIYA